FPYRRGDVLLHNSQNLLKEHGAMTMTMSTHLSPLVALIVGILILIFPRFLNYLGLTKSRGFAWPQVLCTGPVGIFSVVSRFDALERKCEKSLGVAVQIGRQPARRSDGVASALPNGLRFADRRKRL